MLNIGRSMLERIRAMVAQRQRFADRLSRLDRDRRGWRGTNGDAAVNETEDLMLMTDLYPRTTGLPMVVWVGPQLWRAA